MPNKSVAITRRTAVESENEAKGARPGQARTGCVPATRKEGQGRRMWGGGARNEQM